MDEKKGGTGLRERANAEPYNSDSDQEKERHLLEVP